MRRRKEREEQQRKWNSNTWVGEFGSGFQSVRSKIGPYQAAQAAAAAAADNDALDLDLDLDSLSTSSGVPSTLS